MKVILKKSQRKNKKLTAIIYGDSDKKIKTVQFGASGYQDYTTHKDDERKQRYIKRHQKNEDWTDIKKAGTWSRFLLWNKKTINESIKDMEKRFNINIVNQL